MGRRLSLVALLFALLAPASEAHAAEAGLVVDLNWGLSDREQDRTGAEIERSGAGWVRVGLQWRVLEPHGPGRYDAHQLRHLDRAIRVARAANARILLYAWNAPVWASGAEGRTTPRNPADFARFMGFLAARYASDVDAYEIWNEPDLPRFWSTGPNPREYAALLKASSRAVRAADPTAPVVFAGLSWNDTEFLEGAYAAGAGDAFDIFGMHPYTSASPDHPSWRARFKAARKLMDRGGERKPIWLTELGYNTSTQVQRSGTPHWQTGVSELVQATYVTRVFEVLKREPDVEIVFWYSLRNGFWDHDANTVEGQFGLLRTDFTPKPAYEAFRRAARDGARSRATNAAATPSKAKSGIASSVSSVTSRMPWTRNPQKPAPSPTPTARARVSRSAEERRRTASEARTSARNAAKPRVPVSAITFK